MLTLRYRDRFLKTTRLQGYWGDKGIGLTSVKGNLGYWRGCKDKFLMATMLSRLLEGDTGIGFSRLRCYQVY